VGIELRQFPAASSSGRAQLGISISRGRFTDGYKTAVGGDVTLRGFERIDCDEVERSSP
jgi:hypothetical protein